MGRQLASFDGITYTYNEEGIRTSKTVDGVTTKYYLDSTNIIYQTNGTDNLYFFYDSKDSIVGFKYNDNNYYYVKNQQGDVTNIADSNGNIIASYNYDPWGKVISVSGSNLELANLNPFRYRSYYYDSDTELYYLQSRYYDPEIGRFINCDNINYIGTQNTVVSYNPFAYCENEPIDYYDPSGNGPILIGTLIGLAVGGIAGAVASYIYKGKVKVSWIVGGMTVGALIGAGIGWIYTTFKGAAASWMAYRAAQISSGASTASSSIGRMFEKWYYGYNKIGKGLQQVTQKINGVTCRFDAIKSGKIIELKNYDWSKYKSYKSIISSFTNQANKYRQFIGRTIHRQKITGIKFYFSSKPPKAIINALKKIGVSVGWVK